MKIGALLREIWLQCGESSRPCKFDKWMRRLDGRGPGWAAGNVNVIVGWMRDEARNRGMEFNPSEAAGLVLIAIRRLRNGTGSVAKADERRTQPVEVVRSLTPPSNREITPSRILSSRESGNGKAKAT